MWHITEGDFVSSTYARRVSMMLSLALLIVFAAAPASSHAFGTKTYVSTYQVEYDSALGAQQTKTVYLRCNEDDLAVYGSLYPDAADQSTTPHPHLYDLRLLDSRATNSSDVGYSSHNYWRFRVRNIFSGGYEANGETSDDDSDVSDSAEPENVGRIQFKVFLTCLNLHSGAGDALNFYGDSSAPTEPGIPNFAKFSCDAHADRFPIRFGYSDATDQFNTLDLPFSYAAATDILHPGPDQWLGQQFWMTHDSSDSPSYSAGCLNEKTDPIGGRTRRLVGVVRRGFNDPDALIPPHQARNFDVLCPDAPATPSKRQLVPGDYGALVGLALWQRQGSWFDNPLGGLFEQDGSPLAPLDNPPGSPAGFRGTRLVGSQPRGDRWTFRFFNYDKVHAAHIRHRGAYAVLCLRKQTTKDRAS